MNDILRDIDIFIFPYLILEVHKDILGYGVDFGILEQAFVG